MGQEMSVNIERVNSIEQFPFLFPLKKKDVWTSRKGPNLWFHATDKRFRKKNYIISLGKINYKVHQLAMLPVQTSEKALPTSLLKDEI